MIEITSGRKLHLQIFWNKGLVMLLTLFDSVFFLFFSFLSFFLFSIDFFLSIARARMVCESFRMFWLTEVLHLSITLCK